MRECVAHLAITAYPAEVGAVAEGLTVGVITVDRLLIGIARRIRRARDEQNRYYVLQKRRLWAV